MKVLLHTQYICKSTGELNKEKSVLTKSTWEIYSENMGQKDSAEIRIIDQLDKRFAQARYMIQLHVQHPLNSFQSDIPAFPKLWVATQKWVAKFCQVGRQSFSGNIYFLSFICKLDKNTFYLVPLLSKFSIELRSSSKFWQHLVMSPHPSWTALTSHESPCKC